MRHLSHKLITATVVVLGSLPLTACADVQGAEETHKEPATVESVDGSDVSRITLEAAAVERLDLQTVDIRSKSVDGGQRSVIPYSATLYGPNGDTWVYTNPEPRTFIREPITIEDIQGDEVILSDGPATGTAVVSVGVAELYGAEVGVGK